MSGHAITAVADELERYICESLAIARPTAVLRRMKINQLANNANANSEIEYSQACSYFSEHAANPQALEAMLSKLQARGDTTHKQFLAMLHVLATDQELEPLRRVQGAPRAAAAANTAAATANTPATATAVVGRASGAVAAKQQAAAAAAGAAAVLGAAKQQPAAPAAAGSAAAGLGAAPASRVAAATAGPAGTGAAVATRTRDVPLAGAPAGLAADASSAGAAATAAISGRRASLIASAPLQQQNGAAPASQGAKMPAQQAAAAVPPSRQAPAAGTAAATGRQATPSAAAAAGSVAASAAAAPRGTAGAEQQAAAGARASSRPGNGSGAVAPDQPTYYGKNPMYGQEDGMSPLPARGKDYAPSLTHSMATRGSANSGPGGRASPEQPQARPALPDTASSDLFLPGGSAISPTAVAPMPGTPVRASPWNAAAAGPSGFQSYARPSLELLPELLDLLHRLPAWASQRPYLTGEALVMQAASEPASASGPTAAAAALASLPPALQETALINDLLFAFMGHSGSYVRARLVPPPSGAADGAPAGTPGAGSLGGGGSQGKPTLTFVVDAELEPCLLEMVQRVLPIWWVRVEPRFDAEDGERVRGSAAALRRDALVYARPMVFHAVAAAMRTLLSDWTLLVTQLEHQLRLGQLNLQALTFHCQGPMSSLKLLASIAAEAASRNLSSAGLLNLLHAKSAALVGDQQGRALVQRLLAAGCQPYFQILDKWLWEGQLDDPHAEFMVQEDRGVGKDDLTPDRQLAYWYSRYTLRQAVPQGPGLSSSTPGAGPASSQQRQGQAVSNGASELDVPVFLQAHADMILTTGKYLNAIRECGQHAPKPPTLSSGPGAPSQPQQQRLQFDPHGAFAQQIAAAHAHASASLLRLLVAERQLLTLLRSLKHYFLLDQGDVLVHLIETAQEELSKPTRDFSTTRLQSLLELAVKTSSAASDAMSDNLSFEMDPRSVVELARAATRAAGRGLGGLGAAGSGFRGEASGGSGALPLTPGGLSAAGGTPASVTSNVRKVLARQQSAGRREPAASAPGGGVHDKGKDKEKEDKPAWDFFLLSYRVSWPHTLVVSPSQLSHYQLVFKLLLVLKLTERQLSLTWHRVSSGARARDKAAVLARLRKRGGTAAAAAGRAGAGGADAGEADGDRSLPWDDDELYLVFSLGQRFMFFVQEFLRYSTFDVLEPLWTRMEVAIRKATNVDQVVQLHRSFLSRALSGLLLSHPRILRLVWSISQLAQAYCKAVGAALTPVPPVPPARTSSSGSARLRSGASRGGAGTAGAPGAGMSMPGGGPGAVPAAGTAATAAADEDPSTDSMAGVGTIFSANLSTLVQELRSLYEALMRREGAGAEAVESMEAEELAESRDELGRLQGLIERLSSAQAPAKGKRGMAPVSLATLSLHSK